MRHRKKGTRFGRQQSHRIATLQSLAKSVLVYQRIKTTHTKAREARRVVDKIITTAKKNSLAARRKAFAILGDRALVTKLFKEIAPLFAKKHGGYTRIIPFNFRKGDGASMVFLELTEKKVEEKPAKPSKKATAKAKPVKAQEVKKEPTAEHPKPAPEVKQKVKEEKTVEDVKKRRAKDEDKKMEQQKGFMKKVKGFFRRRTNM
ncbi:MAG: 50S ribosomal protein L17 [Candidatus Omnitrophica bacterium]|nr:50S ribosomal protein L17 [Candidatus Omnitrophota bacterium]